MLPAECTKCIMLAATWDMGPWQQCSVSCGEAGVMRREVRCRDQATQHYVDASMCADQSKPLVNVRCEPAPPRCNSRLRPIVGLWSMLALLQLYVVVTAAQHANSSGAHLVTNAAASWPQLASSSVAGVVESHYS